MTHSKRKAKARLAKKTPPAHKLKTYTCVRCNHKQDQQPYEFDRSFKPKCQLCGGSLNRFKFPQNLKIQPIGHALQSDHTANN